MNVSASILLGRRSTVALSSGSWALELSAGSDHEGGRCATAMVKRRASWPLGMYNWLGVHAANGKHAGWGWYGVAAQTVVRGWRVAVWAPHHGELRESPVGASDEAVA